jgi:hypothetical protein
VRRDFIRVERTSIWDWEDTRFSFAERCDNVGRIGDVDWLVRGRPRRDSRDVKRDEMVDNCMASLGEYDNVYDVDYVNKARVGGYV